MKVKAPKDLWAGLMFIAFGVGFIVYSQFYDMGSALRMGPAYFPTVLGGILTLLGLVVLSQAFIVEGDALPSIALKPLLIVLAAMALFAALIRTAGLIPATLALVIVSAYAGGRAFKWKEVLLLAIGLTLFVVGVFSYGLGLPFTLWPGH